MSVYSWCDEMPRLVWFGQWVHLGHRRNLWYYKVANCKLIIVIGNFSFLCYYNLSVSTLLLCSLCALPCVQFYNKIKSRLDNVGSWNWIRSTGFVPDLLSPNLSRAGFCQIYKCESVWSWMRNLVQISRGRKLWICSTAGSFIEQLT